jgi:release factor glutamine methyltransferase
VASPEHDARALALHVLGLWRPSDLLTVEEVPEAEYDELVARRAERVPLQHLVGSAAFRYLELAVGPGVFLPRPETEVVVDWAVTHAPPYPVAVDLCTGSGAIALSLAHELAGATVHAVEVDAVALKWARRNDPEQKVAFHLGGVEGCLPELDGTVDLVVSNPPYLPLGSELDRETAEHDPELALWGGPDGLAVVRQVEAAARRLLKPGGLLVVEHDVTHGEAAPELLRAAGGWSEVADHEDLTGRPRFVTARWQS